MHEAAAHVVGASVEACRQVWSRRESLHAANITGGLHHAMPDRASGFCVYNDVAVGIRWLLDQGAERVAYVDVDVHHGDGVERIFWDDPRVLTISLHETGQMLFPGTGFPADVGGPGRARARRSTSRCRRAPATPAGCAPSTPWCRRCCASSQPDVLVTQHGCDSHVEDPLAHLMLTVDGQRAAYLALHDLAHEVRRRPLGGDRRRRLRGRRRGAAGVDAPAGDRRRAAAGPRAPRRRRPGASTSGRRLGARRAAPDDRRPDPGVPATGRRATTRTPGWTGRSTRPATAVFPLHGLDPLP